MGIIPDSLTTTNSWPYITNAFLGSVSIQSLSASNNKVFQIIFSGLTENACISLTSQDWVTGSSSGLISVTVFKGNYSHFDTSGALFNGFNCQGFSNEYSITGCPNGSEISVPIPVSLVAQMCKNCEDSSYGCNIALQFY